MIDRLSADLREAFPDMQGFSPRNLKYMRAFAAAWPERAIVQEPLARIPWYHHIALLEKLDDPTKRLWYARQAIEQGWSHNILVLQIQGRVHERQGKAVTNFATTLPPAESDLATQVFKDPYLFDFLGTAVPRREREVEQALVDHIQRFLLELGTGFAFVGRQVPLEVGDQDAYPELPEQRAIAHILGTLDDKIELNQRTNETLEAMARTLFNSWFVELDPDRVRVADLIRNGVLEIGDGYRAKNSELGEPGLAFIRAGDLNKGFETTGADMLRDNSVARAGNKVGRVGDVAFTSKGTIGRFARVTEFTEPFVYSPQVCFWRSLDPERLRPAILYCWMQTEDLRSQIEAVAGQTDMAPYVSLRDQRMMEVPIFPASQQTIAARIASLLVRQALLAEENKTLGALRDALLPRLISGELRFSTTKCHLESGTG